MIGNFSSPGWLLNGVGRYPKRRSRHIRSQMEFFGSSKWSWAYARNKKRDISLWRR